MKNVMDAMKPGRVVLVESLPKYSVRFGILMNSRAQKEAGSGSRIEKLFKVLILTRKADNKADEPVLSESEMHLMDDNSPIGKIRLFRLMMYYSHTRMLDFEPEINEYDYPSHQIIEVRSHQILELVDEHFRVDVDVITSDVNKRDMPRFKYEQTETN